MVAQLTLPPAASWLRHSAASESSVVRLLCFAHAGGGASSFNHWRRVLPDWLELVRVQLPGREDRAGAPLHTRVDALMQELGADLETLVDRPLVVYGHSLGAILAFEAIRALRRLSHSLPLALFVSGRRAPHKAPRRWIHDLPETALLDVLQEMGGSTSALLANPRWRGHYLSTIRADLELSDAYVYRDEARLDCPLHAYLGEDDAVIDHGDWRAWSEHAAGEFERGYLPGRHFFTPDGQATLVSSIVTRAGALMTPAGIR